MRPPRRQHQHQRPHRRGPERRRESPQMTSRTLRPQKSGNAEPIKTDNCPNRISIRRRARRRKHNQSRLLSRPAPNRRRKNRRPPRHPRRAPPRRPNAQPTSHPYPRDAQEHYHRPNQHHNRSSHPGSVRFLPSTDALPPPPFHPINATPANPTNSSIFRCYPASNHDFLTCRPRNPLPLSNLRLSANPAAPFSVLKSGPFPLLLSPAALSYDTCTLGTQGRISFDN
jgi:hypothetical protein